MSADQHHEEDVKVLHSMGYAQELSRRMGLFQNFAILFSIICILAGGITAFPLSLSGAGGASLGLGWSPARWARLPRPIRPRAASTTGPRCWGTRPTDGSPPGSIFSA